MVITSRKYNFFDYIRIPFKASFVYCILIIINKILGALEPSVQVLVTAKFVDTAIDIFNNGGRERIYTPLILLMVLVAYTWVSGMLINFVNIRLNMRLNEEFRFAVTEKRSKLAYKHIENNDSWDLISRVSWDPAGRINGGFNIVLSIGDLIIRVVSLLFILAAQVWWAAIAILVFSVPLFFVSIKSGKQNYEAFKEANKHQRRAGYLAGVLTGRDNVEERTLFSYTESISDKWYEKYEIARKITTKAQAINFIKMKSSSIITIFVSFFIAGVLLVPLAGNEITLGMFMGLVNATFSLVQMMSWQLSNITQQLANNGEYLKDLSEFSKLEETEGANDLPDRDIQKIQLESIEFRNVRFKYPGTDTYVLDGLNMVLHSDKHYAFVGVNGAGKTTITKLLTGLYDDFEGEILINDKNIREFKAGQLKALFSVVYQDFAKYYISLRDNVALGNAHEASDKEILDALNTIELTDELKRLDKGIDTPLGKILEGGTDISGGEWQRVAIARTLVSKAPIYILDEPTASLDPVAESNVYKLFSKISREKMSIFITHRLGAATLADEILVLRDGKIIEQGSHKDLIDLSGAYAEMFNAQRSWYK